MKSERKETDVSPEKSAMCDSKVSSLELIYMPSIAVLCKLLRIYRGSFLIILYTNLKIFYTSFIGMVSKVVGLVLNFFGEFSSLCCQYDKIQVSFEKNSTSDPSLFAR